jgi:hypothetical protein
MLSFIGWTMFWLWLAGMIVASIVDGVRESCERKRQERENLERRQRWDAEPSLSLWEYLKDSPLSALVDSPAPLHMRQQEVIQRLQRLAQAVDATHDLLPLTPGK